MQTDVPTVVMKDGVIVQVNLSTVSHVRVLPKDTLHVQLFSSPTESTSSARDTVATFHLEPGQKINFTMENRDGVLIGHVDPHTPMYVRQGYATFSGGSDLDI